MADPAGGAYSASSDHLAGEEGLTAPSQYPHSRSWPFGPRFTLPVSWNPESAPVDIAVVQWTDDDNDTAGDVYTGAVCSCKSLVDLTLVLDSSTTVRDWTAIREFAVSIIDWFDVGQSQARVAVIVVGRTSSVVVRLDQLSHDRQQLYSAIRNIPLAGGPRSLYFSLVTSPHVCLRLSTVFCCLCFVFCQRTSYLADCRAALCQKYIGG